MPRFALALLLVAACSSGSKRVGSSPSWRGGTSQAPAPAPVTFAPTSPAATRYNEPPEPPPSSPLGDAVAEAVREAAAAAKVAVPVADARLFRACAELAQVVPEEGLGNYRMIEFATQRQGLIEPAPYVIVTFANAEPALIAEQLKAELAEIIDDHGMSRFGVGIAKRKDDGTSAIVFALQQRGLSTSPIPRAVPAGGTFVIDAVVDERFREPDLFVTRPNGTTERLGINHGKHGAFKANVPCGNHTGRQQVEVTASGSAGSTVLANFPVWCGAQPPATLTVEPTIEDDGIVGAEEAEKRLLALMNRDRVAAGLAPLVRDDRVVAVARAHSEDMHRSKFVAHTSPTTGGAPDRVQRAGIKSAVVLENVARAYGVGDAHSGLMNSPGHRASILAAAATHVGVGVVLGEEVAGRRAMFVTQVFIRIPPKVVPARAAELVRQRIAQVRPVGANPKLQSIAQELAEGLAAGKSRESLWPGARKKLDAMNTAYARVGSVISAAAELDSIDGKGILGDEKPDDIGVGIGQGNHPDLGEGAIWVVVLMAEKMPAKTPAMTK